MGNDFSDIILQSNGYSRKRRKSKRHINNYMKSNSINRKLPNMNNYKFFKGRKDQ